MRVLCRSLCRVLWVALLVAYPAALVRADIMLIPVEDRVREAKESKKRQKELELRRKKEAEKPSPVAIAEPVEVGVRWGGHVDVPLRAVSSAKGPARFILREPPKYGTLSEQVTVSGKEAVVTYTQDKRHTEVEADSFSYSVQVNDLPASAPAQVSIQIVHSPPALRFPASIDFGRIFVGEEGKAEMVLQNKGGGVCAGRVKVSEPWTLESDTPDYRLGAGESRQFVLKFRAAEERGYSGAAWVDEDPQHAVELRARAVSPFAARFDGAVSPAIHLENRRPVAVSVALDVPIGVTAPKMIELAAGEERLVPLPKNTGIKTAITGEVVCVTAGVRLAVGGMWDPDPPKLAVDSGVIQMGPVFSGATVEASVTLRNTGGIELGISATSEGGVRADPSTLRLPVDGTARLLLSLPPQSPGPFAYRVRLASEADPVTIELQGTALPSAGVRTPASALPASVPVPTPSEAEGTPPEPPRASFPLPAGMGGVLSQEGRGRDWVRVGWDVPSGGANFRIEGRRVSLDAEKRHLLQQWIEVPGLNIQRADRRASAKIEGLKPGGSYTMRLVTSPDSGTPTVGEPFTATTLPARRGGLGLTGYLVLLAVALAAWSLWGRLRSKSQVREETDDQSDEIEG